MRNVPPKASAMLEALRGLGYSSLQALQMPLAERYAFFIIKFVWNGVNSRVEVMDNGIGMSGIELEQAMRLGEKDPLTEREAHDLGRFGMGLKTASFSQCRSLLVASKCQCPISVLRWDLDIIAQGGGRDWLLIEEPTENAVGAIEDLNKLSSGTLVIWEKLDRVVSEGTNLDDFLNVIDGVERHLAMVFHRYLENKEIQIRINEKFIQPWDPYLIDHSATQRSQIEKIRLGKGRMEVQCFILPHKERLDSKTYLTAGGPDGWTAHQGFYVYRGRRLLVAGSWLGLGKGLAWTKEEAHRLARIKVDISNDMDDEWKIDIRKSMARPPNEIRTRLIAIAEHARKQARQVFAYRGPLMPRKNQEEAIPVWVPLQTASGVRYQISVENPVIQALLDDAGALKAKVQSVLRIIEETVPVQRIWLDTAESKEAPSSSNPRSSSVEVNSVLNSVFLSLVKRKGYSIDDAKKYLLRTEPFDAYPELVKAIELQEES